MLTTCLIESFGRLIRLILYQTVNSNFTSSNSLNNLLTLVFLFFFYSKLSVQLYMLGNSQRGWNFCYIFVYVLNFQCLQCLETFLYLQTASLISYLGPYFLPSSIYPSSLKNKQNIS